MGSLNIDFIARDTTTQSEYLYSDVHLDLVNDYKKTGNYVTDSTNLVDIRISSDMDAVRNSLTSIFSTIPGQRLLLPEFGVNIQRFIFSPISEASAYSIGELLKNGVERWEPRVEVQKFSILPNAEDHSYEIAFEFYVPSLKSSSTYLGSIVHGEGFVRG